jgi:hypothetical protein
MATSSVWRSKAETRPDVVNCGPRASENYWLLASAANARMTSMITVAEISGR